MFTYRQLTVNDTEQVIDLVQERPEVFNGYTDSEFKTHIVSIVPTVMKDPLFFNLGLFLDGHLQGAAMMKEMSNSPAWVWGHWVGRKTNFIKIFSEEGLKVFREMDHDIFDEMEQSRKLNRYFVAYRLYEDATTNTLKSVGMSERFFEWLKSKGVTRGSNYKFFTDCLIEPNTLPKYDYQKSIIANRTWPIKLGIRVGFKPED